MKPPKPESSITRLPKLIDTPTFDHHYHTANELFVPCCNEVEETEPGEGTDL